FKVTHHSQEYLAVLKTFDIINVVAIIFIGLATFPLALFVYYKILTTPPFKSNYTFRLIAIAGVVDFLVYLSDLIFLQCSTYPSLNWFFDFLNETGLSRFVAISGFTLFFLQILLSLAVAINRLLFLVKRQLLQMHGRLIFFASIGVSAVLSVICSVITHPRNFNYARTYVGAGEYAHSPDSGELPSNLGYTLLSLFVSSAVFLVTISLARSIFAYRRQISLGGGGSVEKGLIVVAISNFVNYILFVGAM
ncbi:hypothetical protein PMAYCL1PPCAC_04474, partial [Pristionchus mayeri]